MAMRGLNFIYMSVALIIILVAPTAYASISVDRTRVIFDGKNSAMGVTLRNNSETQPYLAQSWMEDENGVKSTERIVVLPPLQRIEPNGKSQIKFQSLPGLSLLPQDRESVFYLNIREIPPKTKKENVLQIALQTKIKFFYRPISIAASKGDKPWQNKIILKRNGSNTVLLNPTPYYITVVNVRADKKMALERRFKPIMIPPFGEITIGNLSLNGSPVLSYINDYGGQVELTFSCKNKSCQVDG
ncbi:MAG: fimbria/pilus periplasmic chaperone [Plesiomonas sp.]